MTKEEANENLLCFRKKNQFSSIFSSVARIQFRLPDGRSQMDRFDPDEPLEVLYRFVEDSVKPGFSRFSLSTTFPSRQLDSEDRGRTLRQLGLVPTATVLVLPAAAAGSRGGGGELQQFAYAA